MSTPSSPDVLAHSPELAAIDILDAALTSVTWALMAANPETESDDWVLEVPDPAVQACLANAVTTAITALQSSLDCYRHYVIHHHHRQRQAPRGGTALVSEPIIEAAQTTISKRAW